MTPFRVSATYDGEKVVAAVPTPSGLEPGQQVDLVLLVPVGGGETLDRAAEIAKELAFLRSLGPPRAMGVSA